MEEIIIEKIFEPKYAEVYKDSYRLVALNSELEKVMRRYVRNNGFEINKEDPDWLIWGDLDHKIYDIIKYA